MQRQFEVELRELKNRILAMGGLVEEAIEKSTSLLGSRDKAGFQQLKSIERKINEENMRIDSICLEVLARLSPVAADLRLILAIIKINTDLERMGDQAMNIGYNVDHYLEDGGVDLKLNLPRMAELVRKMVRDSLDAFMKDDVGLAEKVLKSDDEVDQFKNRVFDTMVAFMRQSPDQIGPALDMILVARNLERMADHATNIAEDVIFCCTGADVRHGAKRE
ncbi:MAG: phosphate signaling complex protein PhoU [Bdellovibrionales bacterium]|jgi:phosphate transport system protein|nr:phosphate signaling complex protein PhoU [Bdellovibrionales bacterium]